MVTASHPAVPRSRAWLAASIVLFVVAVALVLGLGLQPSQAAASQVPAGRRGPSPRVSLGGEASPATGTRVVTPTRTFLPFIEKDFRFAELTVTKAVAPAQILAGPGQVVTYTIIVRNIGGTWGKLTAVNDLLPAGFTFVSMASGSDVGINPVGTTGTLAWSLARLVSPGGQVKLIYRVTPGEVPGAYVNRVAISGQEALVLNGTAQATLTIQPGILFQDSFEQGMGLWTPFLNDPWRLEAGQWYWGATSGVSGSGAAVHDCCVGEKEAADALLMYLGAGAEQWTDYRVESKMLLHGGVTKEGTWSLIDGDPIGLWVRGQYDYVEGETIRWKWVTGYYVVIAGKPDRDNMVVRLSQMQTLTDCWGDACNNPQNLYTFNNPHLLAEAPVNEPYVRDRWYKLTVEVRGPRIMVWLDDQKMLDYVDDKEPFLTGTVGFKTHESWWASFDDVVVTPLH